MLKNANFTTNIARIANAVPFTLYSRATMNDEIVVLNCQKCYQCLTGHKFLGIFFQSVLYMFTCSLHVFVLIVPIVTIVPIVLIVTSLSES